MRLWAQSYAHGSTFSSSAAISVAAHVVLFGAAAYGTASPTAFDPDTSAEERIYYLPPPDRLKGSISQEELHYVELGSGIAATGTLSEMGPPNGAPAKHDARAGGVEGRTLEEHPALAPVPATDSVYSVLSVEESAARIEESAAPVYPPELIAARIEGSVPTRYVIDTMGRADPSTLEIMAPSHQLFEQSVRDALPGMRFHPATVQGHKVRQLVEQRFDFRIVAPPPSAPAEHTRVVPVPGA